MAASVIPFRHRTTRGRPVEHQRLDVLLAALASIGPAKAFEPVHVQKAMFLIDRRAHGLFGKRAGQHYEFVPYDYGPFDSAVYHDLDRLAQADLVHIDQNPQYGYRRYAATEAGRKHGEEALQRMKPEERKTVEEAARFVLSLPFRALVSAIYRQFPEMKANSVFKG